MLKLDETRLLALHSKPIRSDRFSSFDDLRSTLLIDLHEFCIFRLNKQFQTRLKTMFFHQINYLNIPMKIANTKKRGCKFVTFLPVRENFMENLSCNKYFCTFLLKSHVFPIKTSNIL